MEPNNGKVVETFSHKSFAEAAVSLLSLEGVEAFIHADDAGGEMPNLDFAKGVRVLVSANDLERAQMILNAGVTADDENGD